MNENLKLYTEIHDWWTKIWNYALKYTIDERKSETIHWNTRLMNENLKLCTEIHDWWTKIWNYALKYTIDERKSETIHWNTRLMNENLKLYTEIHDWWTKIWNYTLKYTIDEQKSETIHWNTWIWNVFVFTEKSIWSEEKKRVHKLTVKVCINVMYQCGYRKMSCLSMKIQQMTYILNSALNA
jgi:hypothetical protein